MEEEQEEEAGVCRRPVRLQRNQKIEESIGET